MLESSPATADCTHAIDIFVTLKSNLDCNIIFVSGLEWQHSPSYWMYSMLGDRVGISSRVDE